MKKVSFFGFFASLAVGIFFLFSGVASASQLISLNLTVGSRGEDVKILQTLLVRDGVYSEGPITGYFGKLTRQAVIRFQEKYADEILKPNGLDRGTGRVGASTRAKLNKILQSSLFTRSGAYPTIFPTLDPTSLKNLFDRFNASNGNNWHVDNHSARKSMGVNLASFNLVSFNRYGFIDHMQFPYPSGTNWQAKPGDGLIYMKSFILKNKEFFGIEEPAILGEPVVRSDNTGDSPYIIYKFVQPKSYDYVINVPLVQFPQEANHMTVSFHDNEVFVRGNFYPKIFIPTSQIKDVVALRVALLGQTYSYSSGCGKQVIDPSMGQGMPCDPVLVDTAVTSNELPNLSIQKTVIVPYFEERGLAMRLVSFITGFAHRDLLYVDAITGKLRAY